MLIEIHMLQNHAPANLNRDDTGSPKDCIFGGVRRARISSQCLKRTIRRSPIFAAELGIELGVRTRQLPELVRKRLVERGIPEEIAAIVAQKASGFGNKEGREQQAGETAQMMFLSPADIEAVADALFEVAQGLSSPDEAKKVSPKDIERSIGRKGWRPITPDIALFGRMITSEAFRDVEASVQVAHAISTHKMEHEFDYFTAVDDLLRPQEAEDERGAGMIGDVEFNSACYYKYFSIDFDGLVDNLAGPAPEPGATPEEQERYAAARREAEAVARRTVLAFLKAAVFTTPSGKQNSFAAHQLPDAILVEVRPYPTPVSYANAFVKPVPVSTNWGDEDQGGRSRDLVEQSILQLKEHVEKLTRKFSLQSIARLWFTTRDVEVAGTTFCDTLDDLTGQLAAVLEERARHG